MFQFLLKDANNIEVTNRLKEFCVAVEAERHVTCSGNLKQMHDGGCAWWASVDNAVVTVALMHS